MSDPTSDNTTAVADAPEPSAASAAPETSVASAEQPFDIETVIGNAYDKAVDGGTASEGNTESVSDKPVSEPDKTAPEKPDAQAWTPERIQQEAVKLQTQANELREYRQQLVNSHQRLAAWAEQLQQQAQGASQTPAAPNQAQATPQQAAALLTNFQPETENERMLAGALESLGQQYRQLQEQLGGFGGGLGQLQQEFGSVRQHTRAQQEAAADAEITSAMSAIAKDFPDLVADEAGKDALMGDAAMLMKAQQQRMTTDSSVAPLSLTQAISAAARLRGYDGAEKRAMDKIQASAKRAASARVDVPAQRRDAASLADTNFEEYLGREYDKVTAQG